MDSQTQKDINKYFEQSKDIDFDLRFMAAQGLSNMLHDFQINLPDETRSRIIKLFITQMNDNSKDVRSNAFRCLGKSLEKIDEECLKIAINSIFGNLKKQEDIDSYATMLKTIICQIDAQFSKFVCSNTLPNLIPMIMEKKPMSASEEHGRLQRLSVEISIDILNCLCDQFSFVIKKEAELLDKVKSQDQIGCLMGYTTNKSDLIRRRASSCLGNQASFIPREEVIKISTKFLEAITTDQKFEDKRLKIQTLSIITKRARGNLDSMMAQICNSVFNETIAHLEEDMIDKIDEEGLSNYLFDLYSIIETFNRESKNKFFEYLNTSSSNNKFKSMILKGLRYNPNQPGFLDDDDDDYGMDEEDPYDYDMMNVDDEDSSWKVRVSAINLLDANLSRIGLLVCSNSLVEAFPTQLQLVLNKDENVQKALMNTLSEVVQIVKHIEDIKFDVNKELTNLVKNICKFYATSDNSTVKNFSVYVINKLVVSNSQLAGKLWPSIFALLSKELSNRKSECTGNNLDCLRICTRSLTFDNLGNDVNAQFQIGMTKIEMDIKQSYEYTSAVANLIGDNLPNGSFNKTLSQNIIQVLRAKIDSPETLMKVKENCLSVVGSLVDKFKSILSNDETWILLNCVDKCLEHENLQFEAFRALEGLHERENSLIKMDQKISSQLNSIVRSLLELFSKKGRSFKIRILKVLTSIGSIASFKLSGDLNIDKLVNTICVISDEDQFMTRQSLSLINYIGMKRYNQQTLNDTIYKKLNILSVGKTLDLTLLGVVIDSYEQLYQVMGENLIKPLMSLFSSNNEADVNQVSLVLSSLILKSKNKNDTVEEIIKNVLNTNNGQNTYAIGVYLQVLGYIGTEIDFSQKSALITVIAKLKNDSKSPLLRSSAYKCLVAMSIGNPNAFLGIIFDKGSSLVENKLYIYMAVKQLTLLNHIEKKGESLNSLLDQLDNDVQNVTDQLSEALFETIGRVIAKFNQNDINLRCSKYIGQNLPNFKQLLCQAACHCFNKDIDITKYPVWQNFIISSTSDADVKVRSAAFAALDSIYYYWPAMRRDFSDDFYRNMAEKMIFDKSLVREDKLGAFTLKEDLGAPIRKFCFSFLAKMLNNDDLKLNYFISPLIGQLDDAEEIVRFFSFKIMTHISNKHSNLIIDRLPELLKKLSEIFEKSKMKRDAIIKEKGRQYQCLEMLVSLVAFADSDKSFRQNPDLNKLKMDIDSDEEWKRIYDDCAFDCISDDVQGLGLNRTESKQHDYR